MPSPVRFPNGVTNVARTNPLGELPTVDPTKVIQYFNDFHNYTAGDWVVTETAAGATQAVSTGAQGGVLLLTGDGAGGATDVNQLQLTNETFRLTSGKQTWIKCRVSATAATMDNFGILIGLAILDTSAVAGVTDGFYFRKAAGAAILESVLELNSAESSVTIAAAPGLTTATFIELAMYYNGKDAVEVYLNGAKVGTHTTLTNICTDEELTVTLASVNATAAAANVLSVDYIYVAQER